MLKLHLDTDFGGDIDLCALAVALNWPGVMVETALRQAHLATLQQSGPLA